MKLNRMQPTSWNSLNHIGLKYEVCLIVPIR